MKIAVVPLVGTAVFLFVFTNALAIRTNKKGGKRTNEVEKFWNWRGENNGFGEIDGI